MSTSTRLNMDEQTSTPADGPLLQSGVLPYSGTPDDIRFLIITNRNGRWILPKGMIEPGMTAVTSAAKEAWEEAGIRGTIGLQRLGRYADFKWGRECRVEIFPMDVLTIHGKWPEHWRRRRWVTLKDFRRLLDHRIPAAFALRLIHNLPG